MTRVGVVCPLPPCPSGPADWVADAAPLLGKHLELVFLVDDVDHVRSDLRGAFDVRPVADRFDPSIDVVIYHLANNTHHAFVYRAAMDGPTGLCEVHDGTIHHLVNHLFLIDGDADAYQAAGTGSHGDAGRDAVNMRRAFPRGELDLVLFDLLPHVLRRHAGAIVHSGYAARLLALDAPEVPTWLARLHAPIPPTRATKEQAGLPQDRFVIGAFGYIASTKRPLLLVEALRRAIELGLDGHLVFAGRDQTHGGLVAAVRAAELDDRVTITGFLEPDAFQVTLGAVDAAVSLRAPHGGETSATVAQALAAGRPTVVQNIGSWTELPDDVVLKVAVDDDEAAALAEAFVRLAADPVLCARLSSAAASYAVNTLSPHEYCEALVTAIETSRAPVVPPTVDPIAADSDLGRGAWSTLLRTVPTRRQRVLAIDCPAWVVASMRTAGHLVTRDAPGLISAADAATFDLVLTEATAPGPTRRTELTALNRILAATGQLLVCIRTIDAGGEALLADLAFAGFSARSPRLDGVPDGLWPPPRDGARPPHDHLVARKASLPALT